MPRFARYSGIPPGSAAEYSITKARRICEQPDLRLSMRTLRKPGARFWKCFTLQVTSGTSHLKHTVALTSSVKLIYTHLCQGILQGLFQFFHSKLERPSACSSNLKHTTIPTKQNKNPTIMTSILLLILLYCRENKYIKSKKFSP